MVCFCSPLMLAATRRFLPAALLVGVLLPQLTWAKTPPPTLLQRIRELIGLTKAIPVAAGGSRSGDAPSVCLISPRPHLQPDGQALALVYLPRPSIETAGPLNELRLERNGQIIWRQLASSIQPIAGRVAWPLDPLQPGESLTLKLRARGASAGDFSVVQFQAASAEEQHLAKALLKQSDQQWITLLQGDAAVQAPLVADVLVSIPEFRSESLRRIRASLRAMACSSDR